MPHASHYAALKVIHEAIAILANWVGTSFPPANYQPPAEEVQTVVQTAKEFLNWSQHDPAPLQIVFDQIHLAHGADHPPKYRPAWALKLVDNERTPRIPYPQSEEPSEIALGALKGEIETAIAQLDPENLAQLTLFLEKFGSHLSVGEPDIALIDQARSTAAVAASLVQNPSGEELALVGGDLMGVQKFIYTISSEGALKSLRARSFYLELATEEIVQQLLTELKLPRTNVIYVGASKFYLLVAATEGLDGILQRVQAQFNSWLRETFQRKVFLAIAYKAFPAKDLKTLPDFQQATTLLAQTWQDVNGELQKQANRKFVDELNIIFDQKDSHQPCKVCHRDDIPEDKLKPLKDPNDPTLACPICCAMYRLGDDLPNVEALVRSPRKSAKDTTQDKDIQIQIHNHYYRSVHSKWKPKHSDEVVFQINNWNLEDYPSNQFTPLLLGNYFQKSSETGGFLSASEMANASEGIKRVGYLRMDVDRLSQIFSKGLGQAYTLPRLASLSRQMTYFFKVYLNSLAEARQPNFIDYCNSSNFQRLPRTPPNDPTKPDKNLRQNLLFIYAGGDDLFVSGAWDEVVAFAFDVYQAFRAYTGYHPNITLSAGINIVDAKFPLYQAASEAGDAEDAAKDNGRDSLSLFGEVFQWEQWLGSRKEERNIDAASREYLKPEKIVPDLQGILPFVQDLLNPQALKVSYPQSFIRNLLITAQLREQKIKETRKHQPAQIKDVTYYLHLPKLAYALSRLPKSTQDHEDFKPIRQSLMSPRNSPYFRAIATWIEFLTRS